MSTRSKIGFGAALDGLGDFAPAPRPRAPAPPPGLAEAAGFTSREPSPPPAPVKQQRRHRTGRSAQINIKARPETIAALQAWADAEGLSIAEAFERLVAGLPQPE